MNDFSLTDGPAFSSAGGEHPLPDWAPFAVPSDEMWRELQRRRNIIRILRELTNMARDEGYTITASLLAETAARAQANLIRRGTEADMAETDRQASALQALEELAAADKPRRLVRLKPLQVRVPPQE